jgi:hypothetical protein
MKRLALILALVATGCAGMTAKKQAEADAHLDACVRQAVGVAAQGYASNALEFVVLVNTCEDSSAWQSTAHGRYVLQVVDNAYKPQPTPTSTPAPKPAKKAVKPVAKAAATGVPTPADVPAKKSWWKP